MTFKIKLANEVFSISVSYPDTEELCQNYLTDEPADFEVVISKEDIDYEREKSRKEAEYEGRVYEDFSEGYLETIAVYRKIAEHLIENGSTVFHGCLVSRNGEGYLFTGRSGIGKSTHVSNWLKVYPDAKVINGDKPILKVENNRLIGYGTPWSGKEKMNINDSIPIKAIIQVTRDTENHIKEIELKSAIHALLSATYRPNTPEGIKKALELALKIGGHVKLYRLGCNMDPESAKVAYEGMNS